MEGFDAAATASPSSQQLSHSRTCGSGLADGLRLGSRLRARLHRTGDESWRTTLVSPGPSLPGSH